MTTKPVTQTELVYGEAAEKLVFIPKGTAEELAYLWGALGRSRTWGEFRRMLEAFPPLLTELLEHYSVYYEDEPYVIPAGDEPFNPDDIPCHADGDWPAWPAQDMLDWMPAELQKLWGRVEWSTLNGPYLELNTRDEEAVVAALIQRGYTCVRDDGTVQRASGY